jgi:hypothetical protein
MSATLNPHSRSFQKKLPAKRAFTGLAGSPLAQLGEPIVQVRAKPGPKPVHGVAMTAAERKQRSRANKKEPEKRNLIAVILKVFKRGLPTPGKAKPGRYSAENVREDNRKRLRQLSEDLMKESLPELQKYLNSLKQTPDSHGRLHNERSGERRLRGEMSEMEVLIAAKERAEHGGKAEPKGAGPASYEKPDSMTDSADIKSPSPYRETPDAEARIEHQIILIINEIFSNPDVTPKCPWCSETFEEYVQAENHLHAEYNKVRSLSERAKEYRFYLKEREDAQTRALLKHVQKSIRDNDHFRGINHRVREQRNKEKKVRDEAKKVRAEQEQKIADARKDQANPTILVDGVPVPTFATKPADIAGALEAVSRWDLRVW